jgi:hypothetical protein
MKMGQLAASPQFRESKERLRAAEKPCSYLPPGSGGGQAQAGSGPEIGQLDSCQAVVVGRDKYVAGFYV